MPRLPTAEDYGAVTPRATRDVTSVQAVDTGKMFTTVGAKLVQMAESEADKLDNLLVQDALTELSYHDTELALGENGYLRKNLKAATDGTLMKEYPVRYQESINSIATKITSPRAKEIFQSRAKEDLARFNRGMVSHISNQFEKSMEVSDKAAHQAAVSQLTVLPNEDSLTRKLREAKERRLRVADRYDTETLTNLGMEEDSILVATTIDAFIASKNFAEAERLAEQYKVMLGERYAKAQKNLSAEKATTLASELGATAIEMSKNGSSAKEVDDYLNKNAGTVNAIEVLKGANTMLARHRQARTEEERETADALYLEFTDGKRILKPSDQIRKDARYKGLSAETQKMLAEQLDRKDDEMRAEWQQSQDRSESKSREREADKQERLRSDPGVGAKVQSLLDDPDRLGAMSEVELRQMQKEIGSDYTRALLSARNDIRRNAAHYKAQKADVDAVLAPITNKANRTRMEALVTPRLEAWKKLPGNEGKIPDTRTVQQIIANTAILLKEEGAVWDSRAYLFESKQRPEGLKGTYLPVEHTVTRGGKTQRTTHKIPGEFVNEVIEAYPHLNNLQILRMWQRKQEKEATSPRRKK